MGTNVVTFRAERVVPRMTRSHDGEPGSRLGATAVPSVVWAPIEDLDPRPGLLENLVDRLAAFRIRCAQLTFYLTDPESWR
jgi:hypothetical protein